LPHRTNINKTNVLITGGSRGIGKACVIKFAKKGHTVWFTYKKEKEKAERLILELEGCNVKAFYLDQGDWVSH